MKNQKSGVVYVLMAAILFSIGGLCIKLIPWGSLAINGARNLLAFCVIMIYAKAKGHKLKITPAVLFGAVCMAGTTTLYVLANKLTTAANAIVLQFTAPVFVIVLSALFLHKKPMRRDILAMAVVFIGIIFFFIDSLSVGGTLGNIVAVLSGICYAGVFMMNSFENSDSLSSILLGQALSAVIGIGFVFGETDFSMTPILGILILGIFQVGLSYIFMSRGLETTDAVTASLTTAIEPVLNPILVAIFCQEFLTPISFVGAAIVILAVVVYNVTGLKQKEKS